MEGMMPSPNLGSGRAGVHFCRKVSFPSLKFSSFLLNQRQIHNYLTTTSVASHNEAAFALRGEDITRCWAPEFEESFRLH
jgi:hypothetical protein